MELSGITYRKLRDALLELTDEQLDMTATVASGPIEDEETEFFPIYDTLIADDTGILDDDHPVLISEF